MNDPIFDDVNVRRKLPLDFDSLRNHGIELIQQMAGTVWTDYNLHDPGVTILEALCYAITDLAYQTDFDISDLLSDKKGNIDYRGNSFFTKQQILTSNPVTIADYRKAIIDEVIEIDNVWLTPVASVSKGNFIKGLYKVEVQVNQKLAQQWVPGNAFEKAIKTRVKESFVSKRNLCEDINGDVIILKPVEIAIKAEIQIEASKVPEEVLAQIYRILQIAINRPVTYSTEREMLKRGYTIDQIYCGPMLTNGLISDGDLKDRQLVIDASDIIQEVSNVEGVILVKSLLISKKGSAKPEKILTLEASEFAFLNIRNLASLDIDLIVDKYRVSIRKTLFSDILQNVLKTENRDFVKSLHKSEQLTGTYRDATVYYSIQNYFPLVYGIGEEGLLSSVSAERKAQAKQLKAYLMLFEQVLANYLAQLDHIGTLFSNDPAKQDKSYFANPLYNVPHANDIITAYTDGNYEKTDEGWKKFKADTKNKYITDLNSILETDTVRDDRKNRMLDHLMARFNESGVLYPVTVYNLLYRSYEKASDVASEIKWKSSFLQDFDSLNYNRARGDNYLKANDELYDFRKKMRKLLYIINDKKGALSSVFDSGKIKFEERANDATAKAKPASANAADESDWDSEIKRITLNKQQINELRDSGVLSGADSQHSNAFVFKDQDISVLKFAININNYRISPDPDNDTYLLLYKAPGAEQWDIISRFSNGVAPTVATVKKLVNYLIKLSTQSEGFYLVEHLLLRPDIDLDVYGFKLYDNKNRVIFEHNDWLTFTEREKAIDKLLKFKPGVSFTIAQQNKNIATNNRSLLEEASVWNGDLDLIDQLVKKAETYLKDAANVLDNAAHDLDNITDEIRYTISQNNDIAENNNEMATRAMSIISQLTDIADKNKARHNITLSVNDKARVNHEYIKALSKYRLGIENLLQTALQLQTIASSHTVIINKELMAQLSLLGKIGYYTGNEYADLKQLFNNIELYGKKSSPRFRMLIKGDDNKTINEDFFSFNMSVIFPEWPARFQDKGYKACVEGLFRYHAPANVKTNIKWLSIAEMKQFESIYSTWKQNLLTNNSSYGAQRIIPFLLSKNDVHQHQ
jgi:hypothetical protein